MTSNVIRSFSPSNSADTDKYSFNWAAKLGQGETISSATLAVSPAGPTLSAATITGPKVLFTVAGGTINVTYTISCTIVTSASRTIKRSGKLQVISL
jgi:hypothetical protein